MTTAEKTYTPDPIARYVVRIPGESAWSEHRSEQAAKRRS